MQRMGWCFYCSRPLEGDSLYTDTFSSLSGLEKFCFPWVHLLSRVSRRLHATHSVDATELQRREADGDGQELPAQAPVLDQLQQRVAADALQGGLLLQHLLHLRAVVHVAPQLPQCCGGGRMMKGQISAMTARASGQNRSGLGPVSQACWSPLSSSRNLGDSGRNGSVTSCSNAPKPLNPSSQGHFSWVPKNSLQGRHYPHHQQDTEPE